MNVLQIVGEKDVIVIVEMFTSKTMKQLKNERTVTYRDNLIPAIIFEGKWLSERYGLKLGDKVKVEYGESEIKIKLK